MSSVIELKEVTLDLVFPRDAIPIVLMQPLVKLTLDREPYRWPSTEVASQLDAVQRTLAIASSQGARFTILPEYTLPGLDGVRVVHQAVSDTSWPANSVVIAGVDGLDCNAYKTVWDILHPCDPIVGSEPNFLTDCEWVNCCVVCVKESSGTVRTFVQPKLTRAWLEQQVRCEAMRTGQGVYIFRGGYEPDGYPCRFLCMICFDWIGEDGGQSTLGRVLAGLNERWQLAGTPNPLHWVFVPQCNDKPCHPLFLNATNAFFLSSDHSFVERGDAVVIHANGASRFRCAHPDSFGFSALVFPPDTFDCDGDRPATVCYKPKHLRQSDILQRCQDAVFREMGPCAHSIRVRVPKYARHDAAGRRPPVDYPAVHPLGEVNDARLRGKPVPASTKWLHDRLDETESLSAQYVASPLSAATATKQQEVVQGWRAIEWDCIERRVLLAGCVPDKESEHRRKPDPDEWGTQEESALTNVLHASTVAALGSTFAPSVGSNHGRGEVRGKLFDIAVLCGCSHVDCMDHFMRNAGRIPNHPVLLVTRDKNNDPVSERTMRRVWDIPDMNTRSQGAAFAAPDSQLKHVGYRAVLDWFINANTGSDIEDKLHELI